MYVPASIIIYLLDNLSRVIKAYITGFYRTATCTLKSYEYNFQKLSSRMTSDPYC